MKIRAERKEREASHAQTTTEIDLGVSNSVSVHSVPSSTSVFHTPSSAAVSRTPTLAQSLERDRPRFEGFIP